jgi:prophage DNA circulation protein
VHSTYDFFKDFAGPFATVVASIAAVCVTIYFARKQAWLAEEKLRYDLFDRRLKVYESIFDFYRAMIGWTGTAEEIAARERFFAAYQQSAFLFAKESGIEGLLKDLNDKGAKVIGFKENGKSLASHPPTYMARLSETTTIMTTEFEIGLEKFKREIAPYLNFHGFKSKP